MTGPYEEEQEPGVVAQAQVDENEVLRLRDFLQPSEHDVPHTVYEELVPLAVGARVDVK